jgi:hypothetical protein
MRQVHELLNVETDYSKVDLPSSPQQIEDWIKLINKQIKTHSVVWVRERTKPNERPPLVGEASAKFWE